MVTLFPGIENLLWSVVFFPVLLLSDREIFHTGALLQALEKSLRAFHVCAVGTEALITLPLVTWTGELRLLRINEIKLRRSWAAKMVKGNGLDLLKILR